MTAPARENRRLAHGPRAGRLRGGRVALLLAAVASWHAAPVAAAGPDPEGLPEGSTEEWIAPSATVGRNELQVSRFEDPRTPEAVLADAAERWRRRPGPVLQTTEGPWHVIVQVQGAWVETIRVQGEGPGTVGLRIRQRVVSARSVADSGESMVARWLAGDRVVNRTEQRDGARVVTTWVAAAGSAPDALLARVRALATAGGFSETVGAGEGPASLAAAKAAGGTATLRGFRRGAQEVVVTASPHGDGSVAVLHWSRPR